MFKVSLLPAAYRKRLEERKKKDLLSRVALVIMLCLAIVYVGVFAEGQILNGKLKNLQQKNTQLQQQFPALQQYKVIFDDLQTAKQMVQSVTPKNPEAVTFLNSIANNTPDYIEIQEINLENWFTAGVCTLTCTCLDYSDVDDYKASFETEEMQKIVKQAKLTSITRQVEEDGTKTIGFTLALTMSMNVDIPTESPKYENAQTTTQKSTQKQDQTESKPAQTTTQPAPTSAPAASTEPSTKK